MLIMKKLIFILLLFVAFAANAQQVVKQEQLTSAIGGSKYDTTTLVTVWYKTFYIANPGTYIVDGQFNADTVSGTANYTVVVEHSYDNATWATLSSVAQTADRDTVMFFTDTTRRPYVRFRNTATTGTQVVKNKVYYTFSKQ